MWSTCLIFSFIDASRVNVASSGTATQSSTHEPSGVPEHAIDGNADPTYSHGSCASTSTQDKPWWRVQLPGVYRVSEIEVTNRNSYSERLNDVEILIGISPQNNGNNNPSILGTERNVTLVAMRMCWSDALFYCRDFHWDLLSIGSPEEQEVINELMASASFPLTSHLWVGLRR
ncbi:hypothetical protein CRUP_016830 [Coryphaenoides rupestris]|nr:hypothetical protein CRUP_016830 [Coryphaenoides rupestris]